MKTLYSVLLCSILSIFSISAFAQVNKYNSGIFLHHSTGNHIWGPNDTTVSVPQEIAAYNKAHNLKDSSAFALDERHWPNAPDNEWVRWHAIFDNKDTTSDIRPILAQHKIVVIKSCFPSCQMTGAGSAADTLKPEEKTIYNYKWHLRSIVRVMKKRPENFFVIWTNAPLSPGITNVVQGSLSAKFCTWMKDTLAGGLDKEFGAFPKNVYVFDYFHKTAGPNGWALMKYVVDSVNSHPSKAATVEIAPQFVNEMFDAILASYTPPAMSTSLTALAFGDRPQGQAMTQTVAVKNASSGPLLIDSVKTRTRRFSAAFTKANVVNGDSSVISVIFLPDTTGSFKDTLFIYTNTTSGVTAIPLSGNSPTPVLTSSRSGIVFPDAAKGDSAQTTVAFYNRTVNPLTVRSASSSTKHFSWSVQTPATVKPNDSLVIPVRFTPKAFGTIFDTLTIMADAGAVRVALQGTSPSPQLLVSQLSVDFGTVMRSMSGMKQITITNGAINTLTIDSMTTRTKVFACMGTMTQRSVAAKETLAVKIAFAPDSVMTFNDTLTIYSNAAPGLMKIPLLGIGEKLTSVEREPGGVPAVFGLSQNYPNPFNPSTTIRFGLAERSRVSLIVYDVTGRAASVLADGEMAAGSYTASFDGGRLSSGVYFYRLQAVHGASVFTETKRFILMK